MRIRVLAVMTLALVLCAPVLAKGKAPHLRLSHANPVTAQGSGFKSLEYVKVTLSMGHLKKARQARATAHGAFSVNWPGVTIQSCDWRVVAVGGLGSKAVLTAKAAVCQTLPPLD
jgi:hypothetical protein